MRKNPLKQFLTITLMLVIGSLPIEAQHIVKGLVVDKEGTPLPGVTVVVRGKESGGTVTSVDGKYALNAESRDTITFSYVGYATKKEIVGNRNEIDVVMQEDDNTLEEMVVVAFSRQKKNSVIGSIETINPSELRTPSTNLKIGRASCRERVLW